MVLCALGTLGVAAWLALLDARGHQVESNMDALRRRTVYANSKALAYRAIYGNHLHSASPLTSAVTYTLPHNLGEATIRAYGSVPLKDAGAVRFSKTGITPFRSYTTDVVVDLSDSVGTQAWDFQLRSYHPVLGGDLLIVNPPTDPSIGSSLVSGNIDVKGRAVFWDAVKKDFQGGIQATDFLLPNTINGTTTFGNPDGDPVLPLNYPIPYQTTGMTASGPAYLGELDIAESTPNAHNDYASRLIATGNAQTLSGFTGRSIGPGPDTIADGPNDDAIEVEISTQSPATLMTTLPAHYPLSSRVLNAVADKNNPAFSSAQLLQIFTDQVPVPNDALAYLTSIHRSKIAPQSRELHEANGTAAYSDGNGFVGIVLESPALPHLIISRAHEVELIGQSDTTLANAAASLDPRGIIINNTGTDSIDMISFEEQNWRRIILSMATEENATPPTFGYEADVTFSGSSAFPRWNLIWELQNTAASIDTSAVSGVSIVGGIRANRQINVSSGQITLTREYNYDGLENLLSRNAWIEAYKQ